MSKALFLNAQIPLDALSRLKKRLADEKPAGTGRIRSRDAKYMEVQVQAEPGRRKPAEVHGSTDVGFRHPWFHRDAPHPVGHAGGVPLVKAEACRSTG